ncbi:hypothetical protein KIW84_015006 [Lathyrus oleraceus]|uniref:Subtilisin-like protease fibronectin type-III domain-containing protein n=1 Tax=Pisum sativum TaxID=3888 RepID=A0A9D5GZS8_PEA|nr:hypothetical protein KIW84_015006 [Pisum sativum]
MLIRLTLITKSLRRPLILGLNTWTLQTLRPGLVYDLTVDDYLSFLCALNYSAANMETVVQRKYSYDIKKHHTITNLNYPSFAVVFEERIEVVKHRRTLTNVGAAGTYKISVHSLNHRITVRGVEAYTRNVTTDQNKPAPSLPKALVNNSEKSKPKTALRNAEMNMSAKSVPQQPSALHIVNHSVRNGNAEGDAPKTSGRFTDLKSVVWENGVSATAKEASAPTNYSNSKPGNHLAVASAPLRNLTSLQ